MKRSRGNPLHGTPSPSIPDFLRSPPAPAPIPPAAAPPPDIVPPRDPEGDDRTIGEVLGSLSNPHPALPVHTSGMEFSDDPFPGQAADAGGALVQEYKANAETFASASLPVPPGAPPRPASVPAVSPGDRPVVAAGQYVQRITINEVYIFDGAVHRAPAWVDRNWLGYEEGVALVIPEIGVAHVGDVVALTTVQIGGGRSEPRMQIYEREEFDKQFLLGE